MQFPNCSGSYDFGGSISHSYHSIYPSSLTGYSTNRFQDDNRTKTINFPKAPITSNLATHAATPLRVSSATTPKVPIAEPETAPLSADVPFGPSPFKSMESEIKNYITKRKDPSSFLQYELSWEEFVKFRELAQKSVPGWEKLNVDYQTNLKQLIIQCAGPGHEIMDDVFMQFWQTQKDSIAHKEVVRKISLMGTSEMDLQDGAGKQPDFSFVDDSADLSNEESTFPTTIFEVAYTETSQKVAVDCGRFIACSVGHGLLAVAIDIKRDTEGNLATVRFSKWELTSIEAIKSWPPEDDSDYSGQNLNTLYRSDAGDLRAPATSFYCISRLGTDSEENSAHYAFHAEQVDAVLITAEEKNPPSGIDILYRHMYREPETSKANEIVYKIPYKLLMDVIRKHVEIDKIRKRTVKRKELPEGQASLQEGVNKRIRRLMEAQRKVEPFASGSKAKRESSK